MCTEVSRSRPRFPPPSSPFLSPAPCARAFCFLPPDYAIPLSNHRFVAAILSRSPRSKTPNSAVQSSTPAQECDDVGCLAGCVCDADASWLALNCLMSAALNYSQSGANQDREAMRQCIDEDLIFTQRLDWIQTRFSQ